jgi:ribosome-associated toxin RatA of RatAB toxin-antitoxin module
MSPTAEASRAPFLAALALTLLAPPVGLAQKPETGWIDEDLLKDRQILIDFGEDRRFRGRIRAAAVVDAAPEQIWDILRDCASAPEYLDNVESCEVIETRDDGRTQIFRQRAKLRWFLPSFEHEFRLDYEPYRRITVSRVSGPLERLDAVWWLIPETATRTRIVYRLDLEGGPLVPNFLLAAPLRRDILNALRTVRERAENLRPPA